MTWSRRSLRRAAVRTAGRAAVRAAVRAAGLVLVVVVGGVGIVAAVESLDPSPAIASMPTRAFGSTPVDDVIAAANANDRPECGLTADRLAAMMLAPVFHETGAVWSRTTSPSPMTLSRWDNQAALYAFGDRATPYQRAFWHPGAGMWQFDSAGYWNLTAAGAISSESSAATAAATMASRYCSSTQTDPVARMKFAWSPWYACVSGGANVCVDRFNEMFVGGAFTNIVRDSRVGRFGGMVTATCRLGGTTDVPCHRIDPARAEGWNTWAAPNAGPTPISAPFYVFSQGDIEYRYWLAGDTGYPSTIFASKPIRADARTSLTWRTASGTSLLCDTSAGRGDCGPRRVATTPWGPKVEDPFGSLDGVTAGAGAVNLRGWAIDPDTSGPVTVHVYVDGAWGGAHTANARRTDVGAAVPGYGNDHGYTIRVTGIAAGDRRVCAYAINVGPYGSANPELGCATVRVSAVPQGTLESVRLAPGGALVVGWAADTDDPAALAVEVLVDGTVAATTTANRSRPDVGRVYPSFGDNRGLRVEVPLQASAAARQICVDLVDVPTTERHRLGCRSITAPVDNPFGSFDAATPVVGGVQVRGWLLDWTSASPVPLTVTLGSAAGTSAVADRPRPDVAMVWPGFDDRRGFDVTVPARRGPQRVCVTAGTRTIGCRDVTVTEGDFADVEPGQFFAEPSRWMADAGITTGFPVAWQFSPSVTTTRAQLVTFLWRFVGQPGAPSACAWADVPSTASFARAACWAAAAGVVTGAGGDPQRFDPTGMVTRAQASIMLWRLAGSPVVSDPVAFADVASPSPASGAVAWMDRNGITTGVGTGADRRFDPSGQVNRAQAATFLWRLAGTPQAWGAVPPGTLLR